MGPPGDRLLLLLALTAPFVLGSLVYVVFARLRVHRHASGPSRWLVITAANALVGAFFLSIVLALGELRYRYFYDTTDAIAISLTSRDWFEHHWHKNQTGFRDSLASYPMAMARPAAERPRVSFVGDSFTAGHGIADVEQRFVNRVRAGRPDWEVHALAALGLDTGGQLVVLRKLLAAGYELDRVVLVYCLNDTGDLPPTRGSGGTGGTAPQAFREKAREPGFLVRHSYVVNTWFLRWKLWRASRGGKHSSSVVDAHAGAEWLRQRAGWSSWLGSSRRTEAPCSPSRSRSSTEASRANTRTRTRTAGSASCGNEAAFPTSICWRCSGRTPEKGSS